MPKRRRVLLAVLIGLLGVLAYDNWSGIVRWIEETRKVDYTTFSVRQLVDDDSNSATFELSARAWRGGPDAIRYALEHSDVVVRARAVESLGFRKGADARITGQWRDELVRLMQRDSDHLVRVAACMALVSLIREELVADVPQSVMQYLRRMIRGDDRDRFLACLAVMYLGERAEPLRQDMLAMDVSSGDPTMRMQAHVCTAMGSLGALDAASTRYLLDVIAKSEGLARQSAVAALTELREWNAEVVATLSALLVDRREAMDVRMAALQSLAEMPLAPEEAVVLLPIVKQTWSWFESDEKDQWVPMVVAVALRANDADYRAMAREALARVSRHEDLRWRQAVIAAGLLRLALADRDEDAVHEVLPELLDDLASIETDWASWKHRDTRQAVLEALVELWEWQRDELLRDRVSHVLTSADDCQYFWERKWTRPLLARLRN